VPIERWTVSSSLAADRHWIESILSERWGGTLAIVNGEAIDLLTHPALIAGERDGLAIFRLVPRPELLLLDALTPNAGVGTALLESLIARLRDHGEPRLFATTTNDNRNALSFYKKRGFRVFETRVGAVDRARALKPSIPAVAANGIPIRDELELVINIEGA
jgi:GNAT superfamily N-acetyltransferase